MGYNAFISYSHAADGKLAPEIQRSLQQLAKPLFQRRALTIFRDETDLSASPELWHSIEEALAKSDYFILLASPKSAQSEWVQKEVSYWLENKSPKTLLIGLTEGEIVWKEDVQDFDWNVTTALPAFFRNRFEMEPLHIDFRDFSSNTDLFYEAPAFKNQVAKFAATIHGKRLSDIIGEDIEQQRKMIRLRNTVIGALVFLLLGTLGFAWHAITQQRLAERSLGYFFKNGENEAAWAYDNKSKRFGVINRNGELLGDGFVWDHPQSFSKGVSIAERDNYYCFLDDEGQVISKRYNLVHKTNSPFWIGMNEQEETIPISELGESLKHIDLKPLNPEIDPIAEDSIFQLHNFSGSDDLYIQYGNKLREIPDHDFIFRFTERAVITNKGGQQRNDREIISGGYWTISDLVDGQHYPIKNTYFPFVGIRLFKRNVKGKSRTIFDEAQEKFGFIGAQYEEIFIDSELIDHFSENLAAAMKNELLGYIDLNGSWVIAPQFEEARSFENGVAIIRKEGKYGMIDATGKELITPQYTCFESFTEGYARVKIGGSCGGILSSGEPGKWGLVDQRGNVIIEPQYSYIGDFEDGFAVTNLDEKSGMIYIGSDGELQITPPTYKRMYHRQGEMFFQAWDQINERLLVNKEGKPLTAKFYREINPLIDGMIKVEANNSFKFGFLDSTFQEVISPQYEEARDFSEGMAPVMIGSLWGYIDRQGELVIPAKYTDAKDFQQGVAFVKQGINWTLIDLKGDDCLNFDLSDFESNNLDNRFIRYSFKWDYGIIAPEGRRVIPPVFNYIFSLTDSLFKVKSDDDYYAVIDHTGAFVLPMENDYISDLSEGRFVTREGGIFSIYDHHGQLQFQLTGRYVSPYYKDLAMYCRNGKCSFINKKGEEVMEISSEHKLLHYKEGFIKIRANEKYGFINHHGEEIIPPKYDYLFEFSEGRAIFNQGGQLKDKDGNWEYFQSNIIGGTWGFLDTNGVEVLLEEYDYMDHFNGDVAKVKKGGIYPFDSTAFINGKGDLVSPYFSWVSNSVDKKNPICEVNPGIEHESDGYSYWHKKGYLITDSLYSTVKQFKFGHGRVEKGGKWGIINQEGQEILPLEYDDLHLIGFNSYLLTQGEGLGFAAITGYGNSDYSPDIAAHLIRHLPCSYESIGQSYENDWLPVKQDGKWGFIYWKAGKGEQDQGILKIPCLYDAVTPFIQFPDGNKYAREYIAKNDLEFWINEQGALLVQVKNNYLTFD